MNAVLNKGRYGKLLSTVLPHVIEDAEQHKKMMCKVEKLMLKGNALTPEEKELLKLMVSLIQQYENKIYSKAKASPLETLEFLMEDRGHRAKDLWSVIGDKTAVSRILSGERTISKSQAKKLASFYNVSAALFI